MGVLISKATSDYFNEQVEYFESDENYEVAKKQGLAPGWYGSKAMLEDFGIDQNDNINFDSYSKILAGYHPVTGVPLTQSPMKWDEKKQKYVNEKGKTRRTGTEFLLTAHKSYSVLYAASSEEKQKELNDAWNTAKEKLINTIKDFQHTRKGKGGVDVLHCPEFLSVAFEHIETRPVDLVKHGLMSELEAEQIFGDDWKNESIKPQPFRHTHLMFMNTVITPDGKYLTTINDFFKENQPYVKALWDSLLKEELLKRGVECEDTYTKEDAKQEKYLMEEVYDNETKETHNSDKNMAVSGFKIKGFTDEQIDLFNARSKEAEEFKQKTGIQDSNIAGKNTKVQKAKLSNAELLSEFKKQTTQVGITPEYADSLFGKKFKQDKDIPDDETLIKIAHRQTRTNIFTEHTFKAAIISKLSGYMSVNEASIKAEELLLQECHSGLDKLTDSMKDTNPKLYEQLKKAHIYKSHIEFMQAMELPPTTLDTDGSIYKSYLEKVDSGEIEGIHINPDHILKNEMQYDIHRTAFKLQLKYCSKYMMDLEAEVIKMSEELKEIKTFDVGNQLEIEVMIDELEAEKSKKIGKPYKLNDQQRKSVIQALSGNNLEIIWGYAGVGKSASSEISANIYRKFNKKILAVAPANGQAETLANSIGCSKQETFSIEGIWQKVQHSKPGDTPLLNSDTVLFIDEAGLADSESMQKIISLAHTYNCKVIMAGDHLQKNAASGKGGLFREFINRFEHSTIDKIVRQQTDWDRQQVYLWATGESEKALRNIFEADKGFILDNKKDVIKKIVDDYLNDQNDYSAKLLLVITRSARRLVAS